MSDVAHTPRPIGDPIHQDPDIIQIQHWPRLAAATADIEHHHVKPGERILKDIIDGLGEELHPLHVRRDLRVCDVEDEDARDARPPRRAFVALDRQDARRRRVHRGRPRGAGAAKREAAQVEHGQTVRVVLGDGRKRGEGVRQRRDVFGAAAGDYAEDAALGVGIEGAGGGRADGGEACESEAGVRAEDGKREGEGGEGRGVAVGELARVRCRAGALEGGGRLTSRTTSSSRKV